MRNPLTRPIPAVALGAPAPSTVGWPVLAWSGKLRIGVALDCRARFKAIDAKLVSRAVWRRVGARAAKGAASWFPYDDHLGSKARYRRDSPYRAMANRESGSRGRC